MVVLELEDHRFYFGNVEAEVGKYPARTGWPHRRQRHHGHRSTHKCASAPERRNQSVRTFSGCRLTAVTRSRILAIPGGPLWDGSRTMSPLREGSFAHQLCISFHGPIPRVGVGVPTSSEIRNAQDCVAESQRIVRWHE